MTEQEQTLSADEMDALREVASPETAEPVFIADSAKVQVLSYNFRQPGRVSGSQLRALKVVHEYFAKRFSEVRPGGLNSLSFDLSLLSVETVSFANFMGAMGNPCFLTQLSSRFDQPVLMEIDLPLMGMLVARTLGDDSPAESTPRVLTSIEEAIAGQWIESVLPILGESWELSAPVSFGLKGIDSDPRFVQVMPDDSPVVSLSFRFQAGDAIGQMTLCYPLEPLQELLEGMSLKMSGSKDGEDDSDQDANRVLQALKGVPFELRAELGRCAITASQLTTLKTGDVLCLDRTIRDSVDIYLGNNHIFDARFGRKGDAQALQILKRRSQN